MAVAPMPPVKIHHIAGQKPAHAKRQRPVAGLAKQMKMIGQKGPGINVPGVVYTEYGHTFHKVVAVGFIQENISFFNPATHHMV